MQQKLPDAGQKPLQPAVGGAPTFGKPHHDIAGGQHTGGGLERHTGMRSIDREDVRGAAEQPPETMRE